MSPRVVYLVDETLDHPVLQSQSLAVIGRLRETGTSIDLLVANGVSAAREEEIARKFLGGTPRILLLSRRHPGSSPLAKAQRALGRALGRRRAAQFVSEASSGGEPLVLHARGSGMHLGGYLRARFESARLVADVRGDAAAEAKFHIGGEAGERRAALVDRMEARALSRADHVLCVSTALLTEVRARFSPTCPATVIPCVADERRFFADAGRRRESRASLGLSTEPLLVYAGSIAQWHQFEATLETFEEVARRDPAARFLVATPDTRKATAMVSARPGLEDRVLVRHGDADAVAEWLNAADIGLLLREAHPLNRVACPTKFAEYALSGLSVVVSEEIGDLSDLVHALGLGRCVPGATASSAAEACIQLLKGIGEKERLERARRAAPLLSLGARLHDWALAYDTAAERAAV